MFRDKNGATLKDWMRWHESQCGHATTPRERRMMIELMAAGYTLELKRPTPDALASPPVHHV